MGWFLTLYVIGFDVSFEVWFTIACPGVGGGVMVCHCWWCHGMPHTSMTTLTLCDLQSGRLENCAGRIDLKDLICF